MKKAEIKTHEIEYKMEGREWRKQSIFGKNDLFECLRSMMKDGYTEFKIITIKK